jgi:pimeloyl-ACP methyl ester carboxylesterase
MENKRSLFVIIFTVIIISLLFTPSLRSSVNIANAQSSPCDNGTIISSPSSHALPVILIHGYKEDSSIWFVWEDLLSQHNIPFCTISFHQSDDKCGSAENHAIELAQIVQYVKTKTGQNEVNIVSHSKGGLDARVYLAHTNTPDVTNLIMIGTPNGGNPAADFTIFWFDPPSPDSNFCTPALFDLATGAPATMANQNTHTNYFTISGVCSNWPVDNDGLVPEYSVESLPYSTPLPDSSHCHMGLLNEPEFQESQNILLGS